MSLRLTQFSKMLLQRTALWPNIRNLSTSPTLHLKQINEVKQGDETIISAEYVDSARKPYVIEKEHAGACPLCSSGLDLKHTDVLILSQFLRSDGCMLPKRITGLCRVQQRRVSTLVAMAQKAGLMPNMAPAWSKKDPKKRYEWKKFNKYFDESTINIRYRLKSY